MLESASARCTVFTSSSDSVLFGAKWQSQSSVQESNVTRQRILHRVNSSTSDEFDECDACDECDESNEKKSYGKMKLLNQHSEEILEEEEASDLIARQLVFNRKSQCPVEMQSREKLFLVNLSPATHETATIDANVCALRHGRCDRENTEFLMTVDLHSRRQQQQEDEDEEKESGEQVKQEESYIQDRNREDEEREEEEEREKKKVISQSLSFCEVASIVKTTTTATRDKNCVTSDSQLPVKCDYLSLTVNDKSNEFDASESVRYFMCNFVHRIFCG